MKALFLVLFFFKSIPLLAGEVQSFQISGLGVDRVFYARERLLGLEQDLAGMINRMATLLQDAPRVFLYISQAGSNAGFNGGRTIVYPELFFSSADRYGRTELLNPRNASIIVGHEFGHAIFETWLHPYLASEHRQVVEKLKELSNKREASLLSGLDLPSYEKEIVEILKTPEHKSYAELFDPYTELFADVAVSFAVNSKSSMFDAVFVEDLNPKYQRIESLQFKLAKLRHFDLKFGPQDEMAMSDVHTKLAYARSYIGQFLWPSNEKKISTNLKILMAAIVEVTERYKKAQRIPDIKEANRDLIHAIQSHLMK